MSYYMRPRSSENVMLTVLAKKICFNLSILIRSNQSDYLKLLADFFDYNYILWKQNYMKTCHLPKIR